MTRRSKREITRAVDDLETGNGEPIDLSQLIFAGAEGELEDVDGKPGVVRCFGNTYRVPQPIREVLREMAAAGETR
jgi:hypothetical protein